MASAQVTPPRSTVQTGSTAGQSPATSTSQPNHLVPIFSVNYLGVVSSEGGLLISWLWEGQRLITRFGSRAGLDAKVVELISSSVGQDAGMVRVARLTSNYILVSLTHGSVTYCAAGQRGTELVLDDLLAVCAQVMAQTCNVTNPSLLSAAVVAKNGTRLRLVVKEMIVQGQCERDSGENITRAASLLSGLRI